MLIFVKQLPIGAEQYAGWFGVVQPPAMSTMDQPAADFLQCPTWLG